MTVKDRKLIKSKIAGLKRTRRFIHYRESSGFARKLDIILQNLKISVKDPVTGVELVASFFETDEAVFGHCDDSNGCIGDVYQYDAQELFVEYAAHCADKEKIVDILIKLNRKDDYGVRDVLIDNAVKYLPEKNIRFMIAQFQKLSDLEEEKDDKRHWLQLVESLAAQIKDAELFEKTRAESWGTNSVASRIDIARVYFESGDIQTALSWVQKIPETETFQAHERTQLLNDIYRQLGDTEKLTDVLYQEFRSNRSITKFQELLDVIGNESRDTVVEQEMTAILAQTKLNTTDIEFLIEIGKLDEAESYLLARADQLNGDLYFRLIPLAKKLEKEDRPLGASMLYRALLNSILKRGYIKAYPYGISYLKKLDTLAAKITDWKGFDDHETYKNRISEKHGRKKSFWDKYVQP